MQTVTQEEFLKGCSEYERHEKRDAMYKVAAFLIETFWGKPADMTDGLGVLLLTWNQAFYRYGVFDFDKLEKCLTDNFNEINSFRGKDIFSLSKEDESKIKTLFDVFLEALEIDSGKLKGRKSPVSVAKVLHILAPNYFPIWDERIARAYNCYYNKEPSEQYICFCWKMLAMANVVKTYVEQPSRPILKLIDEYNYSKYTQGWI